MYAWPSYFSCLFSCRSLYYCIISRKSKCYFAVTVAENASRWCHSNGSWDGYTDFSECSVTPGAESTLPKLLSPVEVTTFLYITGYTLSLLALSVAVFIFIYFKWVFFVDNMRLVVVSAVNKRYGKPYRTPSAVQSLCWACVTSSVATNLNSV